ncbi:MAG: J domain-containing protein [Leptospiraceae bacterium]|nr:J domain-containing protein [Leptospiraceae bacterium]
MNQEAAEAFPLAWPEGRKRSDFRERSRFDSKRTITNGRARDELVEELARLGAESVTISTNVPLRRDGSFYASAREPDDPGVAVYFMYKDRWKCFSCDKYTRLRDNVWAIRKTIECIRGIERWGTGDMVEAAVAGFDALPAPGESSDPYSMLGVKPGDGMEVIYQAWREKIAEAHPDRGGSPEDAARINAAYQQIKELRAP